MHFFKASPVKKNKEKKRGKCSICLLELTKKSYFQEGHAKRETDVKKADTGRLKLNLAPHTQAKTNLRC